MRRPRQPRARVRSPRDGGSTLAATSPATCPTSRSTRSSLDPSNAEHDLRRHRRRHVRHDQRAAQLAAARQRDAQGRGLAARLRRRATACSPPAPTVAAPTRCTNRDASAGARRVQGRLRQAGRPGPAPSTTRSPSRTSATPTRPASPSPTRCRANTTLRVGRQRRPVTATTVVRWNGLTIPAGGSIPLNFSVQISAQPAVVGHGDRQRRDQGERGRGCVGTTGSPHTTPIAPAARGESSTPASQHRRRQGRARRRRYTSST